MADICNSETTLSPNTDSRISELSETCNEFNHTREQAPKSPASVPKDDDVVREMSHVNSGIFPSSDAVLRKAEYGDFEEGNGEQDKNVIHDVVQQEQDKNSLNDAVWEKKESASGSASALGHLNGAVSESQESVDAAVLCNLESKPDEINGAVSGYSEMGYPVKCSLKIEVIDETALVGETPELGRGFGKEGKIVNFSENSRKNANNKRYEGQETGSGNKEKRARSRGRSAKNKNSGANLGLTHNLKGKKKVYSRKELEALRFVGLDGQKKKWAEVYCGLGPAVQEVYDGLVDSGDRYQYQQKHIRVNFNPRFRNEARPSIFGDESYADDDITHKNPRDATSGFLPSNDENGCLIEQGDYIEDDSDEDYISIHKPAFFVTGEPDFDSGPPEDGLEYLRRVRWEAAQIPKVKVAKIDRSKLNKEQTIYMPQIPDVAKCREHLMPLKEWEDAFLADFSELRLSLSQYEVSEPHVQSSDSVNKESSSEPFESILHDKFHNMAVVEDSCQSIPCSISQSCGSPRLSSVANVNSDSVESPSSKSFASGASENYPTLPMILLMDSVARVSMLRKRISMAESTSNLSWTDCLWLFALSAAVDCPLDADTCAAFRSLLRKCASLRAEKLELDEEVAMLNILATISGRYFGQLEK
ncbi:hypothetical protein ACH5RR_032089 [Cinchona calisaya]|uniref:Survival motor neuron interacting protein 1 n=1 Tax=Cinchona calisaya TaxID=153742 RepID=A0ABD2YK62_9GENT